MGVRVSGGSKVCGGLDNCVEVDLCFMGAASAIIGAMAHVWRIKTESGRILTWRRRTIPSHPGLFYPQFFSHLNANQQVYLG